jgi:hemolysin activation/secretion protein
MRKAIIATLIAGFFGHGFAATKADLPSSVNPANVMNTLSQTLPGAEAPIQGNFGVMSNPQNIQNAKNVSNIIILKSVKLYGAAHQVPANVTAIYQAKIGQKMSFKEIQAMAAEMEQAYRNDGFILVQVILPPQEIGQEEGVVQLDVIEGQIESVIFKGDAPQAAKAQLQRYAEQIEREDPISYASIDRFLVLSNDLPGIDVSATLVQNPKVVGGSDLIVNVKQTPASAFVNYNNRGTQYIGPDQLSAGASIYDILGADSLSVTGATIPNASNEMVYGSISYDLIYGALATEINPTFTTTHTNPGSSLAPFDMEGVSTQFGLNVNQPILTSTAQKVTFQSSLLRLNSYNNVFTNQQLYDDTLTALSFGVDYQGVVWQTYNDVNFSVTAGLPILGAPQTLTNPSIAGATTQFIRYNINTSDIRYFTQRSSVAVGTQFQLSPSKLISSEQINYGGSVFGQAFNPNVISGDSGALGSLALRYDLPTPGWMSLLQPEIFYDVGNVGLNGAPSGVASGATGESAGFGLNMVLLNHWQAGLTLAKPLKITQTMAVDMGWQGFFNITGAF